MRFTTRHGSWLSGGTSAAPYGRRPIQRGITCAPPRTDKNVRSATFDTSTAISAADWPDPTTNTRPPAYGSGVRYSCEWLTVPAKLPGYVASRGDQNRPVAMMIAP